MLGGIAGISRLRIGSELRLRASHADSRTQGTGDEVAAWATRQESWKSARADVFAWLLKYVII